MKLLKQIITITIIMQCLAYKGNEASSLPHLSPAISLSKNFIEKLTNDQKFKYSEENNFFQEYMMEFFYQNFKVENNIGLAEYLRFKLNHLMKDKRVILIESPININSQNSYLFVNQNTGWPWNSPNVIIIAKFFGKDKAYFDPDIVMTIGIVYTIPKDELMKRIKETDIYKNMKISLYHTTIGNQSLLKFIGHTSHQSQSEFKLSEQELKKFKAWSK